MTCKSLKNYLRKKGVGLKCPSCDGKLVYREGKYGGFYGCENYPQCTTTHGAHPNGSPLGTPGDEETRKYRIRAHKLFDKLWKTGILNRSEAYQFLRRVMHLSGKEAHIGSFSKDECEELIFQVERWFGVTE